MQRKYQKNIAHNTVGNTDSRFCSVAMGCDRSRGPLASP
jgi:hypothetical protein